MSNPQDEAKGHSRDAYEEHRLGKSLKNVEAAAFHGAEGLNALQEAAEEAKEPKRGPGRPPKQQP